MPRDFVTVARTGEVEPGTMKLVHIGDERILLVNLGGRYHAIDDECPHSFGILSMGQLYGEEVLCQVHGAAFNVKTGAVLSPPADRDLTVYSVRVEGDYILIGPPHEPKE